MITKDEIEAKAADFGLHAANIERDYIFPRIQSLANTDQRLRHGFALNWAGRGSLQAKRISEPASGPARCAALASERERRAWSAPSVENGFLESDTACACGVTRTDTETSATGAPATSPIDPVEGKGMPHVDDLILYLRIVYSRRFIDRLESVITSEIKQLRVSKASRLDRRTWSEEARRSLRYALFLRYYASFENHLKVICERFAHSRSLPLRLTDVSGDNFLNKTNKYLTRVARCEPLDKHPL